MIQFTTEDLYNSIYRVSFHKTYVYTHILKISDHHCSHGIPHELYYVIDVIHIHIFGLVFGFISKQQMLFFIWIPYASLNIHQSPSGPSLLWGTMNTAHFEGTYILPIILYGASLISCVFQYQLIRVLIG